MTAPATLYEDALAHDYLRKWRHDEHHRRIGATLASYFGLNSGDRVIEVGAGFGRYTALLRSLGLRVLACEPDPRMLDLLKRQFADDDGVTYSALAAEELDEVDEAVAAICGFHVLHHLSVPTLRLLAASCHRRMTDGGGFRGWFFLEPNQRNPLYALQTAITPGMRFREERGIWLTDFQREMGGPDGGKVLLGSVGLFPPRAALGRLPARAALWRTSLAPGLPPFALYRVFGERSAAPGALPSRR